MSWVTNTTAVRLVDQTFSSSLRMISRVMASSAANGSSISNRDGSPTKARAIPTRCCIPPDSSPGNAPANVVSPTMASIAFARSVRSARPTPWIVSGNSTLRCTLSHGSSRGC